MSTPTSVDRVGHRRILVADEDPKIVAFIIETLRVDGHAVFHAYDGQSASELVSALGGEVHLVISNTRVNGLPGIELIHLLRTRLPSLPIMYLANIDRSTPAIEAELPRDVPILREPFTAEQLRALVLQLLVGRLSPLDAGRQGHTASPAEPMGTDRPERSMADDWNEALKRFNEQTAKRREKARESDEEAQRVIREADERHASDDEATREEGPA